MAAHIQRIRSVALMALALPALLLAPVAPWAPAARAATPPTVELLDAPAPGATVPHFVHFAWQGADADGIVTGYRYAIDPPEFGNPYWIDTMATEQRFAFQTSDLQLPIPATGPVTFTQPHTLLLESVDNDGLMSDPVSRSFFSSTVAPEVQILLPSPGATGLVAIDNEVTVQWHGTDSDGVFINRPVRYKYALLGDFSGLPGGIDQAWSNPDEIRQIYAPDFAGWTGTGSDSTTVHFTNLNLGSRFLFCVVGFDEAGAYSARFARAVNMIQMQATATPAVARTWGALKARYR